MAVVLELDWAFCSVPRSGDFLVVVDFDSVMDYGDFGVLGDFAVLVEPGGAEGDIVCLPGFGRQGCIYLCACEVV